MARQFRPRGRNLRRSAVRGRRPPTTARQAPAHVGYVDSLSKTLGGGLRIGWVAASGPVLDRIIAAERSGDIHTPTLPQLAMARFLAAGAYPGQAERVRGFYRRRLDALREAIEDHLGAIASYAPPLGGGHIWVTLDVGMDERELADEAVRQGVAYAPGGAMRVERAPELAMRLSFSYLEPDQIAEGVRRIAAAVRVVRGRRSRPRAVPV